MIRVAIVGYGNLGAGVELGLRMSPDMSLVGVFSRRNPSDVKTYGAEVFPMDRIHDFDIDVCILCGGSAKDLPHQTPLLARHFNTVDSFDTHALIKEHKENVGINCESTVSIVSVGWDPGLFSLNRLMAKAILPSGTTHTFWGKGVSQGHSDALRKVLGVADAVQYTIPNDKLIAAIKNGDTLDGASHTRVCYVVLDGSVSEHEVHQAIVTMPHYFAPYQTEVHFITQEELQKNHTGMPHGGLVLHKGYSSENCSAQIEFKLELDSNPQFTALVLIAYARASVRMNREGQSGAFDIFDIAPRYIIQSDDNFDIL